MLKEALDWLSRYEFHGIKPGLARITLLLKKLGNPHKALKFVHIAGTNGKGSTAVILEAILRAHGLKTGLYTSPHLFALNERYRVNGVCIGDEELARQLKDLKRLIGSTAITYFEITTALAFKYFYESSVDIVILECGLGGRLDATNVVIPEVSVITSVGFDHTKYLGKTIESIAFEKAGVIKRKKPCVLGKMCKSARRVVESRAKALDSRVYLFERDFFTKHTNGTWYYQGSKNFSELDLSLKGRYQGSNLGCALKAAELLEEKGIVSLREELLREALKGVTWLGRYQRLKLGKKEFLLDVAHNLEGARELKKSLEEDGFVDFLLIFGMSNEDGVKAYLEVLNELLPLSQGIFLCEFDSPRRIVTLEDWKKSLNEEVLTRVKTFKTPEAALNSALKETSKKVLITGSIYFVRHWLKLLTEEARG